VSAVDASFHDADVLERAARDESGIAVGFRAAFAVGSVRQRMPVAIEREHRDEQGLGDAADARRQHVVFDDGEYVGDFHGTTFHCGGSPCNIRYTPAPRAKT